MVPGPWSYIFLKLVIFRTKQKSSKADFQANDLMLKILPKAMYLDSPDQVKSQNLTPKCKILNVFLDLTRSKERELFNWLSNLKNVALSNDSENMRNVIQMVLKESFFSKKIQKIAQRLDTSPSDSYSVRRLVAPPPGPVCDTFELH